MQHWTFPHADQRGGGSAGRDPAAAEGKGAAAAEAEVGGVPRPGGQAEVEALLGFRGESVDTKTTTTAELGTRNLDRI